MLTTSGDDRSPGNGVPDSLVRIELITCYHRNPGLEGTCGELAERIGRNREQVESQMRKLVQLCILDRRQCDGETRYTYIPPYSLPLGRRGGDRDKPGGVPLGGRAGRRG